MKRYQVVSIACSILIIIAAVLMGCDSEVQAYSDSGRMKVAKLYDSWFSDIPGELVVDTQTGVEYWFIEPKSGEGGSYSLTLLVDQDGKPLIWKGE